MVSALFAAGLVPEQAAREACDQTSDQDIRHDGARDGHDYH
jgi:hypothetical protein